MLVVRQARERARARRASLGTLRGASGATRRGATSCRLPGRLCRRSLHRQRGHSGAERHRCDAPPRLEGQEKACGVTCRDTRRGPAGRSRDSARGSPRTCAAWLSRSRPVRNGAARPRTRRCLPAARSARTWRRPPARPAYSVVVQELRSGQQFHRGRAVISPSAVWTRRGRVPLREPAASGVRS